MTMTYPTITLPQLLEQTAAKSPGATALIYFGTTISYEQLQDQVNRLAAGLQALGVAKGDRVALMMPNCPQFVISYFGALRAGAIVTATSSMYTAREAAHQWNDAGVKVVIADRRLFPRHPAGPPATGLRPADYSHRHAAVLPAALPSALCTPSRRQRIGAGLNGSEVSLPRAGDSPLGGDPGPFPDAVPEWSDAVGYCLPAVHRRHDRNLQGRDAHPRQSGDQRLPGR